MVHKTLITLITILVLAGFYTAANAQQIDAHPFHSVSPEDIGNICTYDPTDRNAYFKYAPQQIAAKQFDLPAESEFQITYVNNCNGQEWPDAAVQAFEHATDIWAAHLLSDVPIKIEATWEDLGNNVLGSAGPTSLYLLSGDGVMENTAYTVAQASALTGIDLATRDGEGFDIVVNINCNFNDWYFGTDMNTPAGLIDMVTVMLHEIGHGIGFIGSIVGDSSTLQADWGLNQGLPPFIYDRFTLDGHFNEIIDRNIFSSLSSIYEVVTGQHGGVYFSGLEGEFALNNQRVPLYAPNPFQSGSSYSHLDQNFFTDTENALMRPQLDRASAIHSPGPVFCGMLQDMGWPLGSACEELIVDDSPLQRPLLSTPANGASGQNFTPSISWESVPGANRYDFMLSTDYNHENPIVELSTTGTTFIPDEELQPNSFYFWRVRASGPAGESRWSNTFRFSTEFGAPAPITLLTPQNGEENIRPVFQFQWESDPTVEMYRFEVSESPDFDDLFIESEQSLVRYSVTQNFPYYTTFYWRVKGINSAGEGEWSDVWSFRTIIERPETVLLNNPGNNLNQIPVVPEFNWNASDRAADYVIQVSTEMDFSTLPIQGIISDTVFVHSLPLEPAEIYYWRVKATNVGGESEWSHVKSFTTEVGETKINPNYPNPFNSVTNLRYQLAERRDVLIDVYDLMGRRVSTLVQQEQGPGVYFAQINASGLASGTYFVRFIAGDVSDIQKMAVIK